MIASHSQLAPEPTAKIYKVPSNEHGQYNPSIRGIGCSLLFTCAIVGRLIFFPSGDDDATNDSKDRYQAFALATSVWFVEHLGRVLNKEASKHGGSDLPHVVMVLTNAVLIYGFLNDDWAPTAAKVGVATLLLFGLGFTFLTKFFLCTVWRCDEKRLHDTKHGPHLFFLVRACGIAMTQSGVLTAALEFGDVDDPVRAFAYSCGVLVLGLVGLPLWHSKDVMDHSLSTRHFAMAAGCALAMLFMLWCGGNEAASEEEAEVDVGAGKDNYNEEQIFDYE